MPKNKKMLLAVYVFGVVGLNLLVAITMKLLSLTTSASLIVLLIGIGFVILLNGLRMLVWMFANNHFPLSTMYPLTSIFYPFMLGVSYFFNEKISGFHILGTLLITIGVFWLGWRVKNETNE